MNSDWPLILAYHGLHSKSSRRYALAAETFERQLTRMLDAGFRPLSLPDAVAAGPFGRADAGPKTFTLTFDDALVSFGEIAFPILRRLGLLGAATVFVPTAFVGGDNAWRSPPTPMQRLTSRAETQETLLGWDAIEDLAREGVAFGSHGHAHLPMQRLTYAEARADVEESLSLLAAHGIGARYLALPFGWHSEECERAIADAGLEAAFSVKWGGRDRFEIRRIPMYGTDSLPTVRLKMSGSYFGVFDTAARLAGKRRYRG
ncbi:MAG TPA: polysaccharide deacetylase family protein [Coriobacteriia bacterium]|jgi:peptidoglycan/xylan/chitin deacetylase (PgdA/CDA1 family)